MQLKIIHSVVCSYYDLSKASIFSKTSKVKTTHVRQVFHFESRKHTNLTLDEIGNYYSDISKNTWSHSSVLNSIGVIQGLIDVDKRVAKDIRNIEIILKSIREVKGKSLPKIKENILKIVINNDNTDDLLNKVRNYTENVLNNNNA